MWLVALEDLSVDQATAVGLDVTSHRVLHGGPGSGKTLVLAHRTRALIDERDIPRERIRLLVYTNVLNSYLKEGLSELGLGDVVLGFDDWCRRQLRERGIALPRGGKGIDHAQVRVLVREALESEPEPPLDALLVDEGQDLDDAGLAILPLAAKHVTIAMDARQQLYETGVDNERVYDVLGVRRRQAALLTAYRCTPHIVALAAAFLDDPEEQRRFRASNLMPIGQREQPVIAYTTTPDEEFDLLASALQERAFLGQRSLVLLPGRRGVHRYAAALRRRGLAVHDRTDLRFDDVAPTVLTYHSAKGLTADATFLPGLAANAFFGHDEAMVARLLFVGITRATDWVWLGAPEVGALPMLDRLDPLVASRDVARVGAGAGSTQPAVAAPPVGAPAAGGSVAAGNGLLDLLG